MQQDCCLCECSHQEGKDGKTHMKDGSSQESEKQTEKHNEEKMMESESENLHGQNLM